MALAQPLPGAVQQLTGGTLTQQPTQSPPRRSGQPVLWNRALCWLRRRHRWRVPSRAFQVEFRHHTFRIRCADCGRERRMTGTEIQWRRASGDWEREP